jgi:hypothetical protein
MIENEQKQPPNENKQWPLGADGLLIICDGETCPAGVELVADEGEGNDHTKTDGLKLEMGVNKGRESCTFRLLVVTLETAVCWQ